MLTDLESSLDSAYCHYHVAKVAGANVGDRLMVSSLPKLVFEEPGYAIDGIGKLGKSDGCETFIIAGWRSRILCVQGFWLQFGNLVDGNRK